MENEVKKIILEALRYEWDLRDNRFVVAGRVDAWTRRILDLFKEKITTIAS